MTWHSEELAGNSVGTPAGFASILVIEGKEEEMG